MARSTTLRNWFSIFELFFEKVTIIFYVVREDCSKFFLVRTVSRFFNHIRIYEFNESNQFRVVLLETLRHDYCKQHQRVSFEIVYFIYHNMHIYLILISLEISFTVYWKIGFTEFFHTPPNDSYQIFMVSEFGHNILVW